MAKNELVQNSIFNLQPLSQLKTTITNGIQHCII